MTNKFKELDEMVLKHKIEMDILKAKSENFELEMWKKGIRYEI